MEEKDVREIPTEDAAVGADEPKDWKICLGILVLVMIVVLAIGSIGGWPASQNDSGIRNSFDQEQGADGAAAADAEGADSDTDDQEADFVPTAEHQALLNEIDEDAVIDALGKERVAALIGSAQRDEDAAWVAVHVNDDAYWVDGDAVRQKLLNLAADDVQACGFVAGFPERYPASDQDLSAQGVAASSAGDGLDATGWVRCGNEVPRLYQWDPRWGYTVYSSTTFALTGCCPTCMSMVYEGLTGDDSMTPYDMGVLATKGGYETDYEGTDMAFLYGGAYELGLTCQEIDVNAGALKAALDAGELVIVNVGPGDFTSGGHYLVAAGYSGDQLLICDPYSAQNSQRVWDVEAVLGQTKALYAFGK